MELNHWPFSVEATFVTAKMAYLINLREQAKMLRILINEWPTGLKGEVSKEMRLQSLKYMVGKRSKALFEVRGMQSDRKQAE